MSTGHYVLGGASDAPCQGADLFFLGMPEAGWDDAGRGSMNLYQWNVTTGQLTPAELTGATGQKLLFTSDQFSQSTYDGKSIQRGSLNWLDGFGRALRTELDTGRTTVSFETGFSRLDMQSTVAGFSADYLDVVSESEAGDLIVLTRFTLANGDAREIPRTSPLDTSEQRVLRDFAYWGQ
ncbi:MAG: hypothetical protein ACOYEV_06060 [Candidatus Nanopelagicales bacterium]